MSSSKLIDGEQLTAYERWELPYMGEQAPKVEEVEPEELQPLTAEQLAEIEAEARKDGYAEGLKKGERDGLAAGKKHMDEAVSRLDKVLHVLSEPLQQVNEAVEEELLELALAIARQIIRRELQQDPHQVLAVVREAMAELPSAARKLRLYLHPDDAVLVREVYAADEGEERTWKIVDDVSVSRGGCRIESESSRIDATLENRLNSVVATLFGGTRRSDVAATEAEDEGT